MSLKELARLEKAADEEGMVGHSLMDDQYEDGLEDDEEAPVREKTFVPRRGHHAQKPSHHHRHHGQVHVHVDANGYVKEEKPKGIVI